MNDSELDIIWNQLYSYNSSLIKEKSLNNDNKCCLDIENIMESPEGDVCVICGIVKKDCNFQSSFSDQTSFFTAGSSTEISTRFCNFSKASSLKRTNYKINNDKNFIKEKTYWILKNFIKNKIEKSSSGIPDSVVEDTVILFRLFEDKPSKNNEKKTIVRRNVRQGIISACLYISCKKSKLFRSPEEIANIMDIEKTLVIKGCKLLRDKLIVKNEETPHISHFLPRLCSDLKLDFYFEKETLKVYEKISKSEDIKKYEPKILTASLLYLTVLKEGSDIKKDISTTTNVSEISMNRIINEIKNIL